MSSTQRLSIKADKVLTTMMTTKENRVKIFYKGKLSDYKKFIVEELLGEAKKYRIPEIKDELLSREYLKFRGAKFKTDEEIKIEKKIEEELREKTRKKIDTNPDLEKEIVLRFPSDYQQKLVEIFGYFWRKKGVMSVIEHYNKKGGIDYMFFGTKKRLEDDFGYKISKKSYQQKEDRQKKYRHTTPGSKKKPRTVGRDQKKRPNEKQKKQKRKKLNEMGFKKMSE